MGMLGKFTNKIEFVGKLKEHNSDFTLNNLLLMAQEADLLLMQIGKTNLKSRVISLCYAHKCSVL